jgi:elongation factor 1-gamma
LWSLQVPAFEGDDGFCISESNAIAYYVADDNLRGGSSCANRALVHQWMSFADSELLPSACTSAFPAMGVMKENTSAVEKAKEDLKKAMAYLDQYLLHSTFLAGERMTLADITVCCTLLLPYKYVFDGQFR